MSEIISSVNNQTAKIKYYNDVNLFRGFAIFIIVWQHILMLIKFYGGVNWETHWQSIENLRFFTKEGLITKYSLKINC